MLIIQRLTLGCCCSIKKPIIQVSHCLASEVAQTIQRVIPHNEERVSKITRATSLQCNQNLLKHLCVMNFGIELTE